MKVLPSFALALAVMAVFAPLAPRVAHGAQPGVRVGVLTCDSVRGSRFNLIVYSTVRVNCVFNTAAGAERYTGRSGIGAGFDLAWNRQEELIFGVFMLSSDAQIGAHSLAGTYVGGKASATAGVGVGTSALLGGGNKNVSLQPLGVEGSSGLGLAAGVAYLVLEPA